MRRSRFDRASHPIDEMTSADRSAWLAQALAIAARGRDSALGRLRLDGGWLNLGRIVRALHRTQASPTIDELYDAVDEDPEERFRRYGGLIQARAGHSEEVVLTAKPALTGVGSIVSRPVPRSRLHDFMRTGMIRSDRGFIELFTHPLELDRFVA